MYPLPKNASRHAIPAALVALLVALSPAAHASSAGVDPTFGDGGRTAVSFDAYAFMEAATEYPGGGYVAAGDSVSVYQSGTKNHWMVAKYLPDGHLDPAFGEGGTVQIAVSDDDRMPVRNETIDPYQRRLLGTGKPDLLRALEVQPDGKILVAGIADQHDDRSTDIFAYPHTYTGGKSSGVLLRLNPDGSPDESFGLAGIVRLPNNRKDVRDLAVYDDGKIALSTEEGDVIRLLPDGSFDLGFGIAGQTSLRGPQAWERILPYPELLCSGSTCDLHVMEVVVDHRDQLVATVLLSDKDRTECLEGTEVLGPCGNTLWRVVRINDDGSVDPSFGGAETIFKDEITKVVTSDNGLYVFGLETAGERDDDVVLTRLDDNGHLDESFAEGGTLRVKRPGDQFSPGLVEASDGSFLLGVGDDRWPDDTALSVHAFDRDGVLQSAFGTSGEAHLPSLPDESQIAILGGPSGSVVVPSNLDGSFLLTRYTLGRYDDPPPPTCTILGTDQDDVLRGTDGDDVICGGSGDDQILGGKGADLLLGEEGDDRIVGQDGLAANDHVVGGDGTDHCTVDREDIVESCP